MNRSCFKTKNSQKIEVFYFVNGNCFPCVATSRSLEFLDRAFNENRESRFSSADSQKVAIFSRFANLASVIRWYHSKLLIKFGAVQAKVKFIQRLLLDDRMAWDAFVRDWHFHLARENLSNRRKRKKNVVALREILVETSDNSVHALLPRDAVLTSSLESHKKVRSKNWKIELNRMKFFLTKNCAKDSWNNTLKKVIRVKTGRG